MKKCYFTVVLVLLLVSNQLAQPGFEPDTIFVSPGWNLIGSKFSGAVADIITTEPQGIISSPFYKFIPGGNLFLAGYVATDSLEASLGYWIKVSTPGLLIVTFFRPWICGHPKFGRIWYGSKIYRSVQIGPQCWLKSNLDIGEMIDNSISQTNNGVKEKYCYGNDISNCEVYGGLYQWNEAMQYSTTPGSQGICPNGWHIPTYGEFEILRGIVGFDGSSLKAVGEGAGAGAGTGTSGFSALLAGYHIYGTPGDFFGKRSYTRFWSSTQTSSTEAYFLTLNGSDSVVEQFFDEKADAYSIRCIKD